MGSPHCLTKLVDQGVPVNVDCTTSPGAFQLRAFGQFFYPNNTRIIFAPGRFSRKSLWYERQGPRLGFPILRGAN